MALATVSLGCDLTSEENDATRATPSKTICRRLPMHSSGPLVSSYCGAAMPLQGEMVPASTILSYLAFHSVSKRLGCWVACCSRQRGTSPWRKFRSLVCTSSYCLLDGKSTVSWSRLTSTKLSDQSGERNAYATNLDQRRRCLPSCSCRCRTRHSSEKDQSISNTTITLHIMLPSTCTEPPHSEQASFFEEQCNTALHLSLPANTRLRRRRWPPGLRKYKFSCPARCHGVSFLSSSRN